MEQTSNNYSKDDSSTTYSNLGTSDRTPVLPISPTSSYTETNEINFYSIQK